MPPQTPGAPAKEQERPSGEVQEEGASQEKARDEHGRFLPGGERKELSPSERGILAGLKAEREKRKVLEAEIADLKRLRQEPSTPPVAKKDYLADQPEETRDFWKNVADPVVRDAINEEVEKRLARYEPAFKALAQAEEQRRLAEIKTAATIE